MPDAIHTEGIRKVYPLPGTKRRGRGASRMGPLGTAPHVGRAGPEGIIALDGLDLTVPSGEFLGLLGPNGAGKTTTIGILTTRVQPTAGRAFVAGADVVADGVAVRQRIGVVPQRPNPDRSLTAIENLVFHAAYFGFGIAEATGQARELLTRLHIADKADARVDELSGGQQQRLMIARALIHEPQVLFLDEPTVGLDPQARHDLWDVLRDLHAQGRTIVMTTHYMEEADRLCERIAIVDEGRLLALDTPHALKARAPGGTLIELVLDGEAALVVPAGAALTGVSRCEAHGNRLHAYSDRGGEVIPALIRCAGDAGRQVTNISLAGPSLESLFISMTGRKLE